ncbi:septum site-determining protein MinC [Fusibacter bizertensis]
MALKGPVEFKGKLNGLYLNINESVSFDKVMAYLKTLLSERGSFYKGSKIIGIKGAHFNYKEKAAIEALISDDFGIEIESLEDFELTVKPQIKVIEKPITKTEPIEVSTPVTEKSNKEVTPVSVRKENASLCDTHFVFGTLRSGKSVHFPGHVVVIGDINPGAEVVAEGNIIVMGRVLGFIHAGSAGNDQSVIIANLLKPTQIRISTYISVPPSDDESFHTTVPEKATVSNGMIKIEKCH